MLSSAYKFIFLHVPKTGGNAVQTNLLPLSEDHKVTNLSQDGFHRFGIIGSLTPRKHAVLSEYSDILGDDLNSYKTVISYRPPFERMVSLYFSGHRWTASEPVWSEEQFISLVKRTPTTADFLRIKGKIVRPDFVLRFDDLQVDFSSLVNALSLPLQNTVLPTLNSSAATSEMVKSILSDKNLRNIVNEIAREDCDLLQTADADRKIFE